MKVQVIYYSLTGSTKRLAEGIYQGIQAEEKSIHNFEEGVPKLDGDILLIGYWGVSGGPDEKFTEFLKTISGKTIGMFCTLGYYADSEHAFDTIQKGLSLVRDRNEIIGSFVANGAVAKSLKQGQKKQEGAVPTEQKELRWKMTDQHPTDAEIKLATERFQERIELYRSCKTYGIAFQSVK